MKKPFIAAWLGLAGISIALAVSIQLHWQNTLEVDKQNYIEASHLSTLNDLNRLEIGVRSIYENIRTLSSLPGVRDVDRHGENFSTEATVTFQQIYNNLASNVAISEVYIVPIDLNPTKIDPITLKTEEPILMFDKLIVDAGSGLSLQERQSAGPLTSNSIYAGPPQVESFEYTQLVDHAKWLKTNYPTINSVDGLKLPFISGPEVITCDNTKYIVTHKDASRSGIMFSVPFFGSSGEIKGMISAIILTDALKAMLPTQHFALVNPGNNYVTLGDGAQAMEASHSFIEKAAVDPALIYSEVLPLSVQDSRNPWYVWSGLPNETFLSSTAVNFANDARRSCFLALLLFSLGTAIFIYMMQKYLNQSALMNEQLKKNHEIAERSAVDAHEFSAHMSLVNEDVARLNKELSQKIAELTEAQDDIVRKGKMAQLGNLVATVAHELRNPLSGVRTTAFMLKRKLKDSPIEVLPQLERIEAGVKRCDNIISQLLDFSRSQPLSGTATNLNSWLQTLLEEEAPRLPETVTIMCLMDDVPITAWIDPERLRRGIINLISNAAEAMTSKSKIATQTQTENPTITISLNKSFRGIEFTISDNGPGIPAELLAKVGEPLFTTKSFGTGLGIAAVQKIAELHGGSLDVESVPGEGAKFTLWITDQTPEIKAA